MPAATPEARPAALSYCATFLPREMLHVYRQVTGLKRFRSVVVTRTRANREQFPFEPVHELKKPWSRAFSRLWKNLTGRRARLSSSETAQLLHLRRETQAALAHLYLGTEALRAVPWLQREACAKVVSFHGADLSHFFGEREARQLLSFSDLFFCRSRSLQEALMERGIPGERIRITPTGVPAPEFLHARTPPAARSRPIRLLQACRFLPKKGLDLTLRATALIRRQGVPVQLTLAGAGELELELRKLTDELGLDEVVRFTGFLTFEQLQVEYKEHDLFLHPSQMSQAGDREGIPNSMLEAMAWALPVIATRHSGIPEAIDHLQEGWLLDQPSPEECAKAILAICEDRQKYLAMSQAARARIQAQFSVERSIVTLENAYMEAIDLARSRQNVA